MIQNTRATVQYSVMTSRLGTGPEYVSQAVPLVLSRMTAQLTCMTLIFEADSPVLIFTVNGMGIPSAMPATSRPSLVGLRSRAAPRPLLVASAHKCVLLPAHSVCPNPVSAYELCDSVESCVLFTYCIAVQACNIPATVGSWEITIWYSIP